MISKDGQAVRGTGIISCMVAGILLAVGSIPARGADIVLPSSALERDGPALFTYRTNGLATGKGELSLKWTDSYGRVVDERKIPVQLNDESEFRFTLDLRRAVAMQNELTAHFTFEGTNRKGARDHREEDARISFIARPPDRKWWDYQIIMWQDGSAEHYAQLKRFGISAGMYSGKAKTPPEFLLKNNLRWYAENIATDFYAEYHRWFPDRPVHWKFLEAKELLKKDPTSKEAFKRHPSLVDPEWLRKIQNRLVETTRIHSPYRPIFYNLGDESGIADLAAFWDFDFSDQSLVEMRAWLKERYGTLAALNDQWGTSFDRWDLVTPMTTSEAMKRADDNFSSWADFKEWMDVSFARAIKVGVDAVHSVDPDAYVAIEGAQLPGWGGYDYSLLAGVLDAIEPYDYACNVEIIRSLKPEMALATTAFGTGPWEKHRVWYELLHGGRGIILWDPKSDYIKDDGTVGQRGREAESYYNELRNGIGALLINSRRQADRIAIHHSQPSLRVEWMLQHKPQGDAWVERKSSSDEHDSNFRWLRESYCRLIEDLGWQYNFVDVRQIEKNELLSGGYQVLFLPHSSALSRAEGRAMREFVEQGGVLIADGNPGAFDEHGRKLAQPLLEDLFGGPHTEQVTTKSVGRGKAIYLNADIQNYYRARLLGNEQPVRELVGRLLQENASPPAYRLVDRSGEAFLGIETHDFRNGGIDIVGLHTNPQLSVADLGPPETISNRRFEKPRTVSLTLPEEAYLYDLRLARGLGKLKQVTIQLDPYEPTLIAISPAPFGRLNVRAPDRVKRGATAQVGISLEGGSPAATHVFHVDVYEPSGKAAPQYSGNLLASHGRAAKVLPFALSDEAGPWEIRVKDILSGQSKAVTMDVF
ncbi:MAG: beta-galactosidase [Terriglobia bacterium]